MPIRPTIKTLTVTGGLLLVVLITFTPILYTLFWHVAHSGYAQLAEKRVSVPPLYFAKTEGQALHINRLAYTILARRPATALITLWPNRPQPNSEAEKEAAFQSFASIYWTKLAGETGVTSGPFRRVGQNESFCMQTAYPAKAPYEWLAISCIAFQGKYFATFYGEPQELTTFYRIIDNS
jgi:hypothetical protein